MAKNTSEAASTPEEQPDKPSGKPTRRKTPAAKAAEAKKTGAPAKKTIRRTRKTAEQAPDEGSAAAITALAAARQEDAPAPGTEQPKQEQVAKGRKNPRKKEPSEENREVERNDHQQAEGQVAPAQNNPSGNNLENRENQHARQSESPRNVLSDTNGDNQVIEMAVITEPPGGDHVAQGKRKRRRNKQRNNGPNERPPQQLQEQGVRDIDTKKLCKKAWEIFSAEVAEEGIALMDDHTSREAARRAFRIAELFLLEQSRRIQIVKPRPQDNDQQRQDGNQQERS